MSALKIKDFLPKGSKARKKPLYMMVRFDKHMALLLWIEERIRVLGTNKQNYMLALIAKDKAESNE